MSLANISDKFEPSDSEQETTEMADNESNKSPGLHPWCVVSAVVFDLGSDEVVEIISLAGLQVDWSLTEKEAYSHGTRKRAYRPRVDSAYSKLKDSEKLRVTWIVSSEIIHRHSEKEDELRERLSAIDWTLDGGVIRPASGAVAELFFPGGSEHDAYTRLRDIIGTAKHKITIVDPYLDSSIFTILGTTKAGLHIELLSHKVPSDFMHEIETFKKQHKPKSFIFRRTREFHDRFIVVDDQSCFQIGASIKDAGNRAFMINQMQDPENVRALLHEIHQSWEAATSV